MAGSKSTQTRFVRHKHLLYVPSLAFLDYYTPIKAVDVQCIYQVQHVGDIQVVA